MGKYIAYGFSNTNRSDTIPEHTFAYKQLEIFHADKIVVDVHWHSEKREQLEELINTMGQGDVIYMYSIDTLLRGKNKGVEYYKQIIEKNIDLFVLDDEGDLPKASPISTFTYGEETGKTFSNDKKEKLIKTMESIAQSYVPVALTGKTIYKTPFTKAFKQLYFEYESYRIAGMKPEAFTHLLSQRLDTANKQTFIAMCKEYEKSLWNYISDFELYCEADPKFLQLPKRSGKIPMEYDEIMSRAQSMSCGSEKERIQKALDEMGIISTADIILRWKLAKEKVPKPRSSDGRIVDPVDFED